MIPANYFVVHNESDLHNNDEVVDVLGRDAKSSPAFKYAPIPPQKYPTFQYELEKWIHDIIDEEKIDSEVNSLIDERIKFAKKVIQSKNSGLILSEDNDSFSTIK